MLFEYALLCGHYPRSHCEYALLLLQFVIKKDKD